MPAGFEIQIGNTGASDGAAKRRTGAVYAVNYPGDTAPDPSIPPATPGDFCQSGECPSPLFEGFVGGKDDRTAFVALADDLEEQVGSALVDGKIADLVEEQ